MERILRGWTGEYSMGNPEALKESARRFQKALNGK